MFIQQIAPSIWATVQSTEPALEFRICVPPDCGPAETQLITPGSPFVTLACFKRELAITISAMFLPRPASALDLLECVLKKYSPSAASTRSSLNDAEAIAEFDNQTISRIRLVRNGRFALKVEIQVRKDEFAERQMEVEKIAESFALRHSIPTNGALTACVDPAAGLSFQYPESFSRVARHNLAGATEYLLADPDLGSMRVCSSEEDAISIAQSFAAWFRGQGCVLRGAPVAAGKEPGQYCYAPLASCNEVEVSTGVTIFPVGDRVGAVGFIGASPAQAKWKATMMKWATDVATSTYTALG